MIVFKMVLAISLFVLLSSHAYAQADSATFFDSKAKVEGKIILKESSAEANLDIDRIRFSIEEKGMRKWVRLDFLDKPKLEVVFQGKKSPLSQPLEFDLKDGHSCNELFFSAIGKAGGPTYQLCTNTMKEAK